MNNKRRFRMRTCLWAHFLCSVITKSGFNRAVMELYRDGEWIYDNDGKRANSYWSQFMRLIGQRCFNKNWIIWQYAVSCTDYSSIKIPFVLSSSVLTLLVSSTHQCHLSLIPLQVPLSGIMFMHDGRAVLYTQCSWWTFRVRRYPTICNYAVQYYTRK